MFVLRLSVILSQYATCLVIDVTNFVWALLQYINGMYYDVASASEVRLLIIHSTLA